MSVFVHYDKRQFRGTLRGISREYSSGTLRGTSRGTQEGALKSVKPRAQARSKEKATEKAQKRQIGGRSHALKGLVYSYQCPEKIVIFRTAIDHQG